MRLPAIAALLFGSTALCLAQSGANWTYEGKTGPLVWGKLDPAYQACLKGHEQSPLDIRGAQLRQESAAPRVPLHRGARDAREYGQRHRGPCGSGQLYGGWRRALPAR